jgi:hypothetical protein
VQRDENVIEREDEFLQHIAAGTDPLTALAAPADRKPPKSGCLLIAMVLVGLLLAALR